MSDLEHVDPTQEAALQQEALDGRLCIAGQQRTETTALEQQHHRRVIDVVLRHGRSQVVRAGIEDAQAGSRSESDDVARACLPHHGIGFVCGEL